MEDHTLLEDLQHTMRGRVPERLFHAKGNGVHGFFEVTNDITKYCAAKLFNEVGKRTPIFSRFSVAVSQLGTAETERRGLRGMAVKFYTEDGNWDLTLNSAQVFLANDPLLLIGISHSSNNEPDSNLTNPNRTWDFLSHLPESTFFMIWSMSDAGMPYSYRHMSTFGGNTFKMINKHGEAVFVRFKCTTLQGERGLAPARAAQLAGTNPDYATEDMVEAIERGDFPSWILGIQVMSFEVAKTIEFNPFDPTKVWSEQRFPVIEVGRITLNRITTNHFDESEQVTFRPGNFVPGIRGADNDKNLAGRIHIYQDTQLYRMGVNNQQLPVNRPIVPVRNYQREGRGVFVSQGAAPHYFPNSFGGPVESVEAQELDPPSYACGDIVRDEDTEADHFAHPREFWNTMLPDHQERTVQNFGTTLRTIRKDIRERVMGYLGKVDQKLAERVEEAMDHDPDDVKMDYAVVN